MSRKRVSEFPASHTRSGKKGPETEPYGKPLPLARRVADGGAPIRKKVEQDSHADLRGATPFKLIVQHQHVVAWLRERYAKAAFGLVRSGSEDGVPFAFLHSRSVALSQQNGAYSGMLAGDIEYAFYGGRALAQAYIQGAPLRGRHHNNLVREQQGPPSRSGQEG